MTPKRLRAGFRAQAEKSWGSEGFRGFRQIDIQICIVLAMVPAIQLLCKNGRVTFERSRYEGTRTIAGCFCKFWEYSTHRRLV